MKSRFLIVILLAFGFRAFAAETPRAEYPRPQFARAEWVNLNGTWTFDFDFGGSGFNRGYVNAKKFDNNIVVPFCPESKLSGVEHKDFIEKMWYQRTLDIPANWTGKKIFLNFGAVDYKAEIYIDGKFITRHFGGSSSFSVDLSRYVTPGKSYNLVVYVEDFLRSGRQTGGKQCFDYNSGGCAYTRTTGIWQTVWMEAIDPAGLKQVQVISDIDQKQLVVHPLFYREGGNTLKVTVKDGNKVVAQKSVNGTNNTVVVIPFKTMKLWSPESPFLYDVTYQVVDKNGRILDEVQSYVGMRKVHTDGNRFYLNNQPYYQRLVLDQGFYPEGIWTAPSDNDLKNDILLSQAAGFNGARLHQKVFEERFYYWADKLGYIVWGEAASWGCDVNNDVAARNFLSEWTEVVLRDRNHPSLVTWTPLNETWGGGNGEYLRFVTDLYNTTKALDLTRPVNDASGDNHVVTDIWSVHNYQQDGAKLRNELDIQDDKPLYRNTKDRGYLAVYEGQPYMIDEFGGIRWVPANKKGEGPSWGYGDTPKDLEALYQRLEAQVDAILSLDHVWGYCYTQLTDVEQEQNGVYLYDRQPKFDMKRIHAIFSKEHPSLRKN